METIHGEQQLHCEIASVLGNSSTFDTAMQQTFQSERAELLGILHDCAGTADALSTVLDGRQRRSENRALRRLTKLDYTVKLSG